MHQSQPKFRSTLFLALIALGLSWQAASADDRPNILWITSEDNSISWISCYGSTNASTPNIDNLAAEGFRYLHCFDNAAVCAPTRNMWITGAYPVTMGTQPMRSGYEVKPEHVFFYNEMLQKAGYFTSNQSKTDYNISGAKNPEKFWDVSKGDMFGWRQRKEGQPFFSVCNIFQSHESRAFGAPKNTKNNPEKMILAKYHPDLPIIRRNYAHYGDIVGKMDDLVGKCIEGLKEDGLYEDTIIIYCSDHGGVLPRSKRFVYSSGIHCPLIVRIPEKYKKWWPAEKPGMAVDRLVSFIDMPKTWLSLTGTEIPKTYDGTIFLGDHVEAEPEYHFAFRSRADERLDSVRVMRDKRYSYHKNYMPYAPAGQYLKYHWKMPAAQAWVSHHEAGKTDEITGRWFRPRVSEEFYDNEKDWDNVNNLIDAPEHQAKIAELKAELRKKQLATYDSGLLPESMRVARAKAADLTIYEMVRDPKLYPLAQYLDAADRALERNAKHLDAFVADLKHKDSGMRYWAVVGLHLLDGKAAAAKPTLEAALQDEEHQVRILAAWTLIKLGSKETAMATLANLVTEGTEAENALYNTLDWMGPEAKPLVEIYSAVKQSGKIKGRSPVMDYLVKRHR